MSKTIKIQCTNPRCKTEHEVQRTSEMPKECVSMKCNWCPMCEDSAGDYYEEQYLDKDGNLLEQANPKTEKE